MSGVPSFAQIRAHVESIRDRYPDARAIGIGMPALDEATPATSVLRIGSEELPVIRCGSVLALRERFLDLPATGPPLVVLTDLSRTELGDDLVARFVHRRLFSIDPWQLVKERFKALHVDPRLVERHAWAARALLDAEPEGGYPPVPSGFLDAETAWRHLFETLAGIPRGECDPEALIAWALDGAPAEKLKALPEAVRTGLAVATEAGAHAPLGRRRFAAARGGVRRPGAAGRPGAPAGEPGIRQAPAWLVRCRTARSEPAGRRGGARPLGRAPRSRATGAGAGHRRDEHGGLPGAGARSGLAWMGRAGGGRGAGAPRGHRCPAHGDRGVAHEPAVRRDRVRQFVHGKGGVFRARRAALGLRAGSAAGPVSQGRPPCRRGGSPPRGGRVDCRSRPPGRGRRDQRGRRPPREGGAGARRVDRAANPARRGAARSLSLRRARRRARERPWSCARTRDRASRRRRGGTLAPRVGSTRRRRCPASGTACRRRRPPPVRRRGASGSVSG